MPSEEALTRERRALEMRRQGRTFDEIAAELGFGDRSNAHRAFKRALARTLQAPAAEVRELEQDRLDRLQSAVWAKAVRGDLGAVDRVLRISERRSRLLGLDHADGVAERQVALAERQGVLVAAVIARVLDGLGLSEGQRVLVGEVVPRELRAIGVSVDGDGDEGEVAGT